MQPARLDGRGHLQGRRSRGSRKSTWTGFWELIVVIEAGVVDVVIVRRYRLGGPGDGTGRFAERRAGTGAGRRRDRRGPGRLSMAEGGDDGGMETLWARWKAWSRGALARPRMRKRARAGGPAAGGGLGTRGSTRTWTSRTTRSGTSACRINLSQAMRTGTRGTDLDEVIGCLDRAGLGIRARHQAAAVSGGELHRRHADPRGRVREWQARNRATQWWRLDVDDQRLVRPSATCTRKHVCVPGRDRYLYCDAQGAATGWKTGGMQN